MEPPQLSCPSLTVTVVLVIKAGARNKNGQSEIAQQISKYPKRQKSISANIQQLTKLVLAGVRLKGPLSDSGT